MEQRYKDEFMVLNDYVEELKAINYGSTVNVISKKVAPNSYAIFDIVYICFRALKKGFLSGYRRIIGLDGCFLKGFVKGQFLIVVGKDGNNQMFPIARAVVHTESIETWSWFID